MSRLTTAAYELLAQGYSKQSVLRALKRAGNVDVSEIEKEFDLFINALKETGILVEFGTKDAELEISTEKYEYEWEYKMSFVEHAQEEYKQLIKENKNELCIK